MLQVTVTTNTLLVTVVSSASTTTATVTLAVVGPAVVLCKHDVVLLATLIPRDTIGSVVGLTTVLLQQPQFQMPSQAYVSYAIGPPHVSFLFRVESASNLLMLIYVTV